MKNEKDQAADATPSAKRKTKPEPGADSQLHNYNVMLTRLGDLFGDEDEPGSSPAHPAIPTPASRPKK